MGNQFGARQVTESERNVLGFLVLFSLAVVMSSFQRATLTN